MIQWLAGKGCGSVAEGIQLVLDFSPTTLWQSSSAQAPPGQNADTLRGSLSAVHKVVTYFSTFPSWVALFNSHHTICLCTFIESKDSVIPWS